jgi:hypothetical protein
MLETNLNVQAPMEMGHGGLSFTLMCTADDAPRLDYLVEQRDKK